LRFTYAAKKYGQQISFIMFVLIFIMFSFKAVATTYDYYRNRKVNRTIQGKFHIENQREENLTEKQENDVSNEVGEVEQPLIYIPKRLKVRERFKELLKINEDIVGWIKIDGTKVDYPILQAEDNEYYLKLNHKNQRTDAGSIFMDFRNTIEGEDHHTILYGHNMKDGSMFGELKKLKNQQFFNNNSTFLYQTLYKDYEVEIFSVYVTDTSFYYIETDFGSDEEYIDFILGLQERSMHKKDIALTAEDRIITLSTCEKSAFFKGRLVVHGRLIEKE
jgi:sortase B